MNVCGDFFYKPEISNWHLDENPYSRKWINTFFCFVVITGSVKVVFVILEFSYILGTVL
jgi:hypothetical protein